MKGVEQQGQDLVIGDVIVEIDGQKIEGYDDLYNALDGKKPGDKVKVTSLRNKEMKTFEVDLVLLDAP
jgi:S1-C subfamily serine protease